ncbi:cadherin repeat domain-containing protein [Synechococcus sp. RS9902]|uniref:cadherin repeat domain-containing protein n=1 Tax=Synechococcus sp. RS9902 TaxID=221345 RepID=UPI0016463B40|nr:cadherin repeat domain-containing protein [Synechococcus sp. RS9902]QNI97980.1 cadherin domain protein [Synechococcus sp. RS9902]
MSTLFSEILLKNITIEESESEQIIEVTIRAWERFSDGNSKTDYSLFSWYADLEISGIEAAVEDIVPGQRYDWSNNPNNYFHADLQENRHIIEGLGSTANTFAPSSDTSSFTIAIITIKLPYSPSADNPLIISLKPTLKTASNEGLPLKTVSALEATRDLRLDVGHTTITATRITSNNEAPSALTLSASEFDENIAGGSAVATLSSADVDAGESFTYALVDGEADTDNSAFVVEGDQLKIVDSPDFETKSSYSIRLQTTDSGGLTFEQAFTISVNDLNEAPSALTVSASEFDENIAGGSAVATLSSADVDAGESFTYALVDGEADTDNSTFIVEGDQLKIVGSPDFETKSSYSIRLQTTDSGGLTFEQAFTISVNDLNEAPSALTLSASEFDENIAGGSAVATLSSADVDAGESFTYALVDGEADTDNSTFIVEGDQLKIVGSPDFETKSSYSIRLQTTDSGGLTFEQAFTISVNDLNEAPSALTLSASEFDENIAGGSAVATLSSADVDAGESFTYALVDGEADTDNSTFIVEGDQLKIVGSPDFETKSSYSIRLQTTDSGGLTFEQAFTISVNDLNEAPSALTLSASEFDENIAGGSAVATLSSADVDAGESFTYALVDGEADTDNSTFIVEGDQLKIVGSPDFETKSSYSIRLQTTDSGGLTFEQAFTISVNDLNEAPSALTLSASEFDENIAGGSAVATLSSADVDAGESFTYALVDGEADTDNSTFIVEGDQLKIVGSPDFETKSSYSIRLQTTDSGGLTFEQAFTISVNDLNEAPSALTLSASEFDENIAGGSAVATLSSADVDAGESFTYALVDGEADTDNSTFIVEGDQLKIVGSPDFETKSSYSIRLQTTDSGGLTFEQAFTISVNDLNEAPSALTLSASEFDENIAGGSAVATLSSADVDAGESFTYALVDGEADTDNSTFIVEGDQLKIVGSPDFETKSSYSIRLQTTDSGGLTFEQAFTISVNDLNEAPSALTLSASEFDENIAGGSAVATLSSADVDAGESFTYALVDGEADTDNSTFIVEGDQLKIVGSPDFETKSSYSIRLQTTDSGGLTFEQAFTISVNDLNEAPSALTLSASEFDENIAGGSAVATLSSADVDAGESFTYALVDGEADTDNSTFIVEGDQLKIVGSPDFETKSSYSIRLQTTDSGGLTFEQAFTISVNDLNEAPSALTLSASEFDENIAGGSAVATLSSADVDAGESFTYALVDGEADTDNSTFIVEGDQLKIVGSPDFETKSSYSIRLQTTDSGGLTFEQAFTISVNDLNEAPSALTLSASEFDENIAGGSAVATLSSADVDAGESFTYALVDGEADTDNSTFIVEGDQLKIVGSPDFETKSSYSIRLQTTDSGGLTFEQAFTISVNDLNEAPSALTLSASEFDENIAGGSAVATLSSADVDAGESFTYALVDGEADTDNSTFIVEGDQLKIVGSPDFETKSSYSIRLQTTDSGGLTFEQAFTISVNDLNEAPSALTLSASEFDENIAGGSAVATLSSADVDAGESFTYALVDGEADTDNSTFIVEGDQLKIVGSPDFETKSSYSIRLQTTDSGGLTFEQAFTITVNDLNEAPSALTLSASEFDENIAGGSAVATLSSADVDAGESFTYALVDGEADTDNSAFVVEGDQLKIVDSPDFETKSSYSIRLQTTDSGGLTFEKAFMISVNDLNEAPSALTLSASEFDENIAGGSAVATLSTSDQDNGDKHTYKLIHGKGDADNSLFAIKNKTIKIIDPPDYETKSTYSIRLKTKDSGGLTLKKAFTLNVNDLLEAPIIQSIDDVSIQKKITTFKIKEPVSFANQDIVTAIIGTKKKDKLTGTSDGEILAGMKGKDVLKGGDSADGFLFNQAKGFGKKNADQIKDFDSEKGDSILLDNDLFDLRQKIKLNSYGSRKKVKKAAKRKNDFVYDEKKGLLYFNENGKQKGWGDGGLFAKLQGAPELSADDFTIV